VGVAGCREGPAAGNDSDEKEICMRIVRMLALATVGLALVAGSGCTQGIREGFQAGLSGVVSAFIEAQGGRILGNLFAENEPE